jgi:CYTH domain-containing protein
MNGSSHLEIERKYLIERPDEALLSGIPGARRYEIEQIYLPDNGDDTRRIRMRRCGVTTEHFYTIKKAVSNLTRVEVENSITEAEYNELKAQAGLNPMRIEKVRWCVPHGSLVIEIDIYPFWKKTAVSEIELEREDSRVSFPDFIHVIREVTHEGEYTNKALAAALRGGKISEPY